MEVSGEELNLIASIFYSLLFLSRIDTMLSENIRKRASSVASVNSHLHFKLRSEHNVKVPTLTGPFGLLVISLNFLSLFCTL